MRRKRRNSQRGPQPGSDGAGGGRARASSLPLPRKRKFLATAKPDHLKRRLAPALLERVKGPIITVDSDTGGHSAFFMRTDAGPVMLIDNLMGNDPATRTELREDIGQIREQTDLLDDRTPFPGAIVIHTDDTPAAQDRARELVRLLLQEAGGRAIAGEGPEVTRLDDGTLSIAFAVVDGASVRRQETGVGVGAQLAAVGKLAPAPREDPIVAGNRRRLREVLGDPDGLPPTDDTLKREAADDLNTYVRFDGRRFAVSENFRSSLEHLATVTRRGGLFERVMTDLERLKRGERDPSTLEALRTFVEYQVYRSGEHLKTADEDSWTEKISDQIIDRFFATEPDMLPRLLSPDSVREVAGSLLAALREQNAPAKATREPADEAERVPPIEVDPKALRDAIARFVQNPAAGWPRVFEERGISVDAMQGAIRGKLRELLRPEVGKNYMCSCLYSQASPCLIRRDMPGFVQDRLRVQDSGKAVYIFNAKNGYSIAYDPRRLGFDPARRHTEAELKEASPEIRDFLDQYQRPPEDTKGLNFELVPFDSKRYMIADVQVPVMADGVRIQLQPPGLAAVDIKIGKSPQEVGIRMTDEPAGVFKRSLNSQRVIEIADWNDAGEKVVFQLKGSGVPAYGFMTDPDWSGGEYLALTIEKGAMIFRDFLTELDNLTNVVPEMVGVSMISDPNVATNEEAAGRFGAVSFRLDRALGIRLSNITYENVAGDLEGRPEVQAVIDSPTWGTEMGARLARNMALANIFGLQYNDSGVTKLVDIGLNGEFADTGGLWNLDKAPKVSGLALLQGIKQHLPGEAAEAFETHYRLEMVNALDAIGRAAGPQAAKAIGALRRELDLIEDRIEALAAGGANWRVGRQISVLRQLQYAILADLAGTMGGDDRGPTAGQRAYAAGGMRQFAEVLIDRLSQRQPIWMRDAIQRMVQDGQLEEVVQALGINTVAALQQLMNLRPEDPWPKLTGDYSFAYRVEQLKGKKPPVLT